MRRAILAASLCCFSALSVAAEPGFYAGAGLGHNDYGLPDPQAEPFDDRDLGYKLLLGWQATPHFGLELAWADHGDATVPSGVVCIALINAPCPDRSRLQARTATLSAAGYLPVSERVDLYARAGLGAWRFDGATTPGGPGSAPTVIIDEDGTGFAWAAGAQMAFGRLGARVEYERINIIRDEAVGMASLLVTWRFR